MAGKRRAGLFVLLSFALVAAVLVGLALFEPRTRATFSPYMYSEGAGVRQYDYRYFGLIPYSKTVATSGLMTEQKVSDHIARAGLVLPTGFDVHKKGASTMRSYYTSSVSSTLYFMEKSGLVAYFDFFRKQAKGTVTEHKQPDGTWTLQWTAPDGVTTLQISGTHSYERGIKKVAGEMLHISVTSPTAK